MSTHPFFSVVIPTYNRRDLLEITLNSVLNQNFASFEVIVVDNCSNDGTDNMIVKYLNDGRITYIKNEKNMERGYSRNRGIESSKGEFLTLLDADDIMYPDCLEEAYKHAITNSSSFFFAPKFDKFNYSGIDKVHFKKINTKNQTLEICKGNYISCIGVFLHRKIYQTLRFTEDPLMVGSEDYLIWFEILTMYNFTRLPVTTCATREHAGRSVYSEMYSNLEYQRSFIIKYIKSRKNLVRKYSKYLHLVNSNYFYHQALYSLNKKNKSKAFRLLIQAIGINPYFIFSKRFIALSIKIAL